MALVASWVPVLSGEVFFAEFQAKCLCLFHGQAVVGCISGVKAEDILVALDIVRVVVLVVLSVCQQTGSCKQIIATFKSKLAAVESVRFWEEPLYLSEALRIPHVDKMST